MKTAFSARELADMRLPGLPATERGVQLAAEREAWRLIDRPGRGGGRLVPVEALPLAAREELARRALAEAQPTVPAVPEKQTATLTASQRRTMEARAALCAEAQRLIPIAGGIMLAEAMLAAHAAAGTLAPQLAELVPIANARRNASRSLSAKTLRRWRTELAAGGVTALAPEPTAKKKAPAPWVAPLLAAYRRPQKPSVTQCVEELARVGVVVPSLRAAQRAIASLGAIEKARGRVGPTRLRMTLRPHRVRGIEDIRPGEIAVGDGWKADFEVRHPISGSPFKPEIVSIMDIASRKLTGFSAGFAERAQLTADALRNAVERNGVPLIFYSDRGPGFRNEMIDAPVVGLLARLGIEHAEALPYNAQARGSIERLHSMCWKRAAKELTTYSGPDMDREAAHKVYLETRSNPVSTVIMSWPAFLRWAEQAVEAYNARPSSGAISVRDPQTGRRRHRSPNEVWDAAVAAGTDQRWLERAELDDLFRPYQERVVRRGTVSLFDVSYFHRTLDDLDLHGATVQVGYDIHDASRVWVRDGDGRLICIAERDANKTPFMPVSFIERAREKAAKAALKRVERKADEIRATLGPSIIDLTPTPPTPEVARVLAEIQAPPKPAAPAPETAEDRYRRWAALDARIQAGEAVSAAEARWHRGYGQTAECDTERLMATVRAEFAARTETRKK